MLRLKMPTNRQVLTGLFGTLGGIALIALLFYLAVRTTSTDETIGGAWFARRFESIGGRPNSFELWHGQGKAAARISPVTREYYRYYGDDCLAYETGYGGTEHYNFACGSRPPFELDSGAPWSFESTYLQQQGSSGKRYEIKELKQRQ